ncbi:MAG: hypothetical protein GH144_01770 [Clostridia bacterium]|jgi:hypothetical protein|nr:hypothetical protein [Clostridia bacterium]
MDYKTIKGIASQTKGLTIKNLLAMTPSTDPFYAGVDNRKESAEWFEKIFNEYGGQGFHLRRLHYKILSLVKNPDGSLYENNKKNWNYLLFGSANARHLGLVGYSDFVDRRNPVPKVTAEHSSDPLYGWYREDESMFDADELYPSIGYNFNYTQLRSYHIEIWAEKSTMDDILIPLCERYNVQFISGAGYESLTHISELLTRIIVNKKPCRIFYISDYDNAGQSMPRQVSRHLEFRIQKQELSNLNIRLKPIILLKEHIKKYELPGAPDKKQTELDALEALHPGEFEKIVTSYLDKYVDLDASSPIREQLDSEEEGQNDYIRDEIKSKFGDELDNLDEEIDDLKERIKKFAKEKELYTVNMEEIGMPSKENIIEDDDWLFATGRNYGEQLQKYKEFEYQQNPNGKKRRS